MTTPYDEERLEHLFQEARRHDRESAPGFEPLLARPRKRRPAARRLVLTAAGIAALALGIWRVAGPRAQPMPFDFGLGELRVPTDFLLDATPSSPAGAIPRIGMVDWSLLELELPAGGDPDDEAGRRERS